MSISTTFYLRLSAQCVRRSISVTTFAKTILGVSTSAPTNWKNGTVPSAELVCRAAQALNVSADYLLGLSDSPERAMQDVSAEESALLAELRQADPKDRAIAVSALRAVLAASRAQRASSAPLVKETLIKS